MPLGQESLNIYQIWLFVVGEHANWNVNRILNNHNSSCEHFIATIVYQSTEPRPIIFRQNIYFPCSRYGKSHIWTSFRQQSNANCNLGQNTPPHIPMQLYDVNMSTEGYLR